MFGEDAVGGAQVANEARDRLRRNHWMQALHEPDVALPPASVPG